VPSALPTHLLAGLAVTMADQFQANRAPGPGAAGPPPLAASAKARQFEDEKKRIIASCFSKPDADGARMLMAVLLLCSCTNKLMLAACLSPVRLSQS